MRGGKWRRGLCRGCLVGSSEAPTRCPTAFVWYFINTSANYFPFFTGQFRSGIGECTLQARSMQPPLALLGPLFEQLAAQDTPVQAGECTQMYANACTHGHACTRPRKCVHSAVFSGKKKERKKKEATDGRSSVQICERYHVGRNAEIASRSSGRRADPQAAPASA